METAFMQFGKLAFIIFKLWDTHFWHFALDRDWWELEVWGFVRADAFAVCFSKPTQFDVVGQFESFHATPCNGEEIGIH